MECSKVYQRAVELLEDEGWEASLHAEYSGRGMYGRTVPAIVTDAPGTAVGGAVAAAVLELSGDQPCFQELSGILPQRRDAMGRSATVYY